MVSINSRRCGFLCAQVVMLKRLLTPPDTHRDEGMPMLLARSWCGVVQSWILRRFPCVVLRFFLCYVPCSRIRFLLRISRSSLSCVKNLVKFRVCSFSSAVYADNNPSASFTQRSFCFRLSFFTFTTFLLKNRLSAAGSSRECGLSS